MLPDANWRIKDKSSLDIEGKTKSGPIGQTMTPKAKQYVFSNSRVHDSFNLFAHLDFSSRPMFRLIYISNI